MPQSKIFVLGCGLAGSWAAHHLCMMGYDNFQLFGGAPESQLLLDKGPAHFSKKATGQTSTYLASHLATLNPNANVSALGDFIPEEHSDGLDSLVVGTMGSMKYCLAAYYATVKNSVPWISLGFPSTKNGTVVVARTPYELDEDEHLAPTILSKGDLILASAKFASDVNAMLNKF